jgi:1,4-alpha-glucan branching enzyme
MSSDAPSAVRDEIERVVRGEHHDPHHVLGPHPGPKRVTVRVWRPDASAVTLLLESAGSSGEDKIGMKQVHPAGVFEAAYPGTAVRPYQLEVVYGERTVPAEDPYRFLPTLGDLDLHLFNEGRHERLWELLGAHPRTIDGVVGTSFAVWAPNARNERVVGDFNGELVLKADPFAFYAEQAPGTASVGWTPEHRWNDADWVAARDSRNQLEQPSSIYELHLGSWRRGLGYRELAHQLGDSWSTSASPTSSSCRRWSIRTNRPGATRSPATTRRRAASAIPTTSATSSTTSTSAASA